MSEFTSIIPNILANTVCGVYKVTFNKKHFYIGSSINLNLRLRVWKKWEKGHGPFPNNNYEKIDMPISHLEIEILELCDKSVVRQLESFYIKENFDEQLILNRSKNSTNKGLKYTEEENSKRRKPQGYAKVDFTPISIVKTEGEWTVILGKIAELGKKDFSVFIRSEVRKLGSAYTKCPKCVSRASGEKKTKRPYIPNELHKKLKEISRQMKIPISSVVDNLIILPLLQEKPSENQYPT